jgi:mono/diheme cytochrome c family protein|tara:strand:+ start:348 stop:677 length:330 start_codon:yes stop_codon:yes gene_type:complete
MKIKSFLLILLFSVISKIHISFADEAKMKKGLEIFNEKAACAACHILKAAGSEGNIGPNLDTVDGLTQASVIDIVTYGLGVMPAFGEDEILTEEEIVIVSFYVANSVGK